VSIKVAILSVITPTNYYINKFCYEQVIITCKLQLTNRLFIISQHTNKMSMKKDLVFNNNENIRAAFK